MRDPCDTVVKSQAPAAGTQVERDSEVTLTVAPAKKVTVPNLSGKSREAALSLLSEKHLSWGLAGSGSEVIGQSIPAGREVDPQTRVTVTLGDPDPDPSVTP